MGLFVYDNPDVKPDFNSQGVRLPWTHPRYQGRVLDALFNERAGTKVWSNGIHPITGTISDTTNITWSPDGLNALGYTGNMRVAYTGINSAMFPTNEATILIKCKCIITAATNNTLLGFRNASTPNNHWPYINSATAYISALHSTRVSWSITNADLEKWHWFVVRSKNGTNAWECYRNLELQYQQNGESTISIGGTAQHVLLGGDTSSLAFTGDVECAFLYNRYLSLSEIASIQDAPYLEYATPRQWWVVAAGGGGGSTHHVHLPLLGVG